MAGKAGAGASAPAFSDSNGEQRERPPMKPGFYNMDCMEALKLFPDGFFDLAIVDPPYGGGYVEADETDPAKLSGGGQPGSGKPADAGASGLPATTSARRPTLHGGGQDWSRRERGRWGLGRFERYHIQTPLETAGGGIRLAAAAAQPLRRVV